MQAQVAASLQHLKEAAAAAISEANQVAAANIEHILRATLAEIRHLEEQRRQPDQVSASMQSGAS
jgi:hypothetical protein